MNQTTLRRWRDRDSGPAFIHLGPIIERLGESHVRGILIRCADFYESEARSHTCPPDHLIRDILQRADADFPALEAVVEIPVLRPNGSILQEPGYDPATRLLLMPPPGLSVPRIPDSPTRGNVDRAVCDLHELIFDFPVVDDGGASFANTHGLLLTRILRHAVRGHVPMALIDKPARGTGAPLLADAVAMVVTGRTSALLNFTSDEAEMKKKITTILMDGAAVVNIDNIDSLLCSETLATVLTRDLWNDRLLGADKLVKVPNRATWIGTGNNVRIGGGMVRRCYRIRIDAQAPRPWQRSGFMHDPLLPWIFENRGRLLAGLLTMARAWFAAGKPPARVPRLGWFQNWVDAVGGVLAFAGIDGFLGNQDRLYEEIDVETPEWEAFSELWVKHFGNQPVTTADVRTVMGKARDEFREALPDHLVEAFEKDGPGSFARKLGWALRGIVDTHFANVLTVRRCNKPGSRVAAWAVEKWAKR